MDQRLVSDRLMTKSSTMRRVIIGTGAIDVEVACGMHGKAEKFIHMEDDTQMDLKKIPCQGVDWVHRPDGKSGGPL